MIAPVVRSSTKMSCTLFVSATGTVVRFVARLENATKLPSAETAQSLDMPSPSAVVPPLAREM
jgi:hypothetical protein